MNQYTKVIVLFFGLLSQGIIVNGQSRIDQLMPRDSFFKAADKVAIRLSPDGQHLGYINPNQNELIIEKIQSGNRIKVFQSRISNVPGFWKFINASQIVYAYPEENKFHLFLGDFIQQTNTKIPLPLQGRVRLMPHPTALIVQINNAQSAESGFFHYHLEEKKWQRLLELDDFYRIYFDQNLQPVLGIRYESGDLTFLRKAKNQNWEKVAFYKWPYSFPVDVLSISNDGTTAYFTDNSETDKTVLVAMNIATGEKQILATNNKADLTIDHAIIHPITQKPQAITGTYGKIEYHFIDPQLEKEVNFLNAQHKGDLQVIGRSEDQQTWLLTYFDGGVQSFYLYHRAAETLHFLFLNHSSLSDLKAASRHIHIIKARDGLPLPCVLFLPPGSDLNQDGFPDRPIPTVQSVHGGPWIGYYQFGWPFHRFAQMLTNRGYAVLFTEFRGASGYGKKFLDAGNLQWGSAMHHDVIDVGKWLIEKQVTPKDKLAISGVSYGAYASFMALAKQTDLYQCAITKYGPSDLEAFLKTPVANNEIWRTRVGNDQTEEGLNLLRAHSPIHLVSKIKKPILMSHGSRDRMAPQSQSDRFAETLAQHKKVFIYTVYPEEGHDYRQPDNNVSYWALGERLLHETIGGNYQPFGNDLEKGNYKILFGKELLESWSLQNH